MRENGCLDAATLRTHEFRRILLIKLSAVGDVIHTIPVLNKLRRRYPRAQIDWLIRPQIAELIRHHPGLSNVLPFSRAQFNRPLSTAWPAIRSLSRVMAHMRSTRYDLVIDLHGQARTALFTLASR